MKFAIVTGLLFGFLAQRAHLGDYSTLIAQLQGRDFTWLTVLLSAGAFAWIGSRMLGHRSRAEWNSKNLILSALGGLVAGAGVGLLGYVPATAGVAFGAGNWDVLPGILGMLAGSYVFAECSASADEFRLESIPVSVGVCLAGWVLVCALLWLPYCMLNAA